MTIQDFINEGRRNADIYLKNAGIENIVLGDMEVIKSNDTRLHSITVGKKGSRASANVYIDDLFDRYESGGDHETIMEELRVRCRAAATNCLMPVPEPDGFILEEIAGRLTVRLLDVRTNKSYLRDRPYIDAGNGLVMAVQINAREDIRSEWIITVNNSLLASMDCTREQLLTEALANTIRLEPPFMARLSDFLFEDEPDNLLTNPAKDGKAEHIISCRHPCTR